MCLYTSVIVPASHDALGSNEKGGFRQTSDADSRLCWSRGNLSCEGGAMKTPALTVHNLHSFIFIKDIYSVLLALFSAEHQ